MTTPDDTIPNIASPPAKPSRRRFLIALSLGLILVSCTIAYLPLSIWLYGTHDETRPADAAIVLGAAVIGQIPSPAFRERIRHGIDLYKRGTVKRLLFTGGRAQGDDLSEAEAARNMALEAGVPPTAILVETSSTTTLGNFTYAKSFLDTAGIRTLLVVSDPMHMRRAMTMARDLGLDAYSSPTPTTQYRSFSTKWHFLTSEWKNSISYWFRSRVLLAQGRL
ncbi:MAG: YdcF family protein [Candidatus Sumerlaeaceae bacterium]|nr:YdcF family protein [Candidatus Sumerlaeaceae bacterium]